MRMMEDPHGRIMSIVRSLLRESNHIKDKRVGDWKNLELFNTLTNAK